MTQDDVDAMNDRLHAIATSWHPQTLRHFLDQLAVELARWGAAAFDELVMPDEYLGEQAHRVVRTWIDIHVVQGHPDPGDDRLFASLAAMPGMECTLLALFGARAHAIAKAAARWDWRTRHQNTAGVRELWWAHQGWGIREVLARLHDAGIVDAASGMEVFRLMIDTPDIERLIPRLRGGIAIQLEFSGQPVPHDRLVLSFAANSRGVFTPIDVVQQRIANDRFALTFTFAGVRHAFEAQYLGDCYDDVAVARAVNTALGRAGREERFHSFGTGDVATYIFGARSLIRQLDDELFLFVDDGDGAFDRRREEDRVERLRRALS